MSLKCNILTEGFWRETTSLMISDLLKLVTKYCEEKIPIKFNTKCKVLKVLLKNKISLKPKVLFINNDIEPNELIIDYKLNGLMIENFDIDIKINHINDKFICGYKCFEGEINEKTNEKTNKKAKGKTIKVVKNKDVKPKPLKIMQKNISDGEIIKFRCHLNIRREVETKKNVNGRLGNVCLLTRKQKGKQKDIVKNYWSHTKFRDYFIFYIQLCSKMDSIEIQSIHIKYV